jgi:PST family polysaccharide transporter
MKRRLFNNVAALGIIQLINYITPFIVLVHLSKTLGIEIYGTLAFAQGIIAISFVFLDFGFSLSATNKISKNRSNKTYVGKLLGGIILVQIIIFLLISLIILIYAFTAEKYLEHRLLLSLILIPIFMQGLMPIWFFQGIEKMKYFAVAAITAKILFAISIVLLVKEPDDYIFVPLLNGLGQMIALISAVFFIYKLGYKIKIPSLKVLMYCLKISHHFFASRIAVASYMNGAILILGIIAQPAVVAIYSMAEQLYKVMQSALGPAAAATYPYMSKEKDSPLMFKLIIGVVILAIAGASAGYFIAPALVAFVFDESWLASIPVFNIFLLAIVVHAGAIMTGYPLAALVGRLDVANASVMTGAGVYFILLAIAFFGNSVTPIILALIMMVSELAVLLHRSLLLIPIALKSINQNPQRVIIK